MKKTYFAPELTVVKISTVRMIAESLNKYSTSVGSEGDPDKSLGRRDNSFWDDDEE